MTKVGVSAVDVSWTQLTPFRSRTFTSTEIISFSKTFCVATWLHYTPFAACGHRKSHAIKKIDIYISHIFQNSTFKPWFFLVKKRNSKNVLAPLSAWFPWLVWLVWRVCQQKLYGVGNRVNIFKVTRISGSDDNREFLHSGNWT